MLPSSVDIGIICIVTGILFGKDLKHRKSPQEKIISGLVHVGIGVLILIFGTLISYVVDGR